MVPDLMGAPWRFEQIYAFLSAPLTVRAAVLVAGAVTLWLCYRGARLGNDMVRERAQLAGGRLRNKRRGSAPRNPDGLDEKLKTIWTIFWDGLFGSLGGVGLGLLCGVLLPAAVLLLATCIYPWLDPSSAHIFSQTGTSPDRLPLSAAALFVADQTFRGGLFDLIEIFGIEIAPVRHNPSNVPFSLGLFAYHFFVGAFVFSGLLLFWENLRSLSGQVVVEIRHQRQRFNEGQSQPAGNSDQP